MELLQGKFAYVLTIVSLKGFSNMGFQLTDNFPTEALLSDLFCLFL